MHVRSYSYSDIGTPENRLDDAREVLRGPLLALGADHPIGDQLANRQREILGRGAEILVDLLDTQAAWEAPISGAGFQPQRKTPRSDPGLDSLHLQVGDQPP